MYNICQIADPGYLDEAANAEDIVSYLKEYGAIDDGGDNGYSSSNKITGRLALVRRNRLYYAIFQTE